MLDHRRRRPHAALTLLGGQIRAVILPHARAGAKSRRPHDTILRHRPGAQDRPAFVNPCQSNACGRQRGFPKDDIRGPFGDHDRRSSGVARGDEGHHGGVDNPEAVDTPKLEVRRHDGLRPTSHRAGASRVMVRFARSIGVFRELLVGVQIVARQTLASTNGFSAGCRKISRANLRPFNAHSRS